MEINIDTVIRLMGVGASLMLLLILMTGEVRKSLKIPLAGMVIGGATYLINSSNEIAIPSPYFEPLDLISITTPFWLWIFSSRLFDRDPPRITVAPIVLAYLLGWYMVHFVPATGLTGFYLHHILSLSLVILIIYTALSGLRDDLVHKRRLIRIFLPVLIGFQTGGVLTYELIFGTQDAGPLVQSINAALISALFLLGGMAMLKADTDLLVETETAKPEPDVTSHLSASETVLHSRLKDVMAEGYYREPGLTIQSLAAHLETPEHRLRALINRKLGHRNFSSFLNGYRISEAKEKLADRVLVDLPILTIAMDLGYNSLAPFNRAFRAETGVTPSDFRKSAIDQN